MTTYAPSRYEITRYEVAVEVDGSRHTLGVVYPKSRSAMLSLLRKLHANPIMHETLVAIAGQCSGEGEWNGKIQRYVFGNGWLGFSGRTERDCDLGI